MNLLQNILLNLSTLKDHEREFVYFIINNANTSNNFEVEINLQSKVFKNERAGIQLYQLNSLCSDLYYNAMDFKIHLEQSNKLSFRCIRSYFWKSSDVVVVGLSSILSKNIAAIKRHISVGTIEQLSILQTPLAKYFFLVHPNNISTDIKSFRKLLHFQETNQHKKNLFSRHVLPAFNDLDKHYPNLYKLQYRRDGNTIVGVDITVRGAV